MGFRIEGKCAAGGFLSMDIELEYGMVTSAVTLAWLG